MSSNPSVMYVSSRHQLMRIRSKGIRIALIALQVIAFQSQRSLAAALSASAAAAIASQEFSSTHSNCIARGAHDGSWFL